MKAKLTSTLLLGLSLAATAAFGQNQAPDTAPPAAPPAATETAPLAEPTPPPSIPAEEPVAAAPEAGPAIPPAPVPAPEPVAVAAPIEAPVLAQADVPKAAPATKDAAVADAVPSANDVLPLILFEDAPLNDAIKTLARQANINFQFDPKLASAAPGPDGKTPGQATVSIRFENVTAQQALDAVLNNHNLQLQNDPKTRTGRITMKDPAALPVLMTKVIQLKHTNPTNLVGIVKPSLVDKRSNVTFDGRTSKLVIIATEAEIAAVDKLVEMLDLPTRQVLIEARIYETSRNPNSIKGVNWSGTLAGQQVTFGNNALQGLGPQAAIPGSAGPPPTLAVPANPGTIGGILGNPKLLLDTAKGFNPATGFLNADGVSAVVSFLNSDSESEVVSTPRAVTLDNEKAVLSVTRAFPIVNVTPGSANSPAGSTVTYTNLGTILEVTPRISANDRVALRIVPEVSSLDGKDQQTVNGQLSIQNIYAIRRIEANVVIPSAHTLVMGGLISDAKNKGSTKVPILGDAPGLGALFRHKSNDHKKSNLLIFVTPTIIEDTDFQGTKTDFLKSPLPDNPSLPKGWWRTTDPHPWTEQQQQQQQSGGQQ